MLCTYPHILEMVSVSFSCQLAHPSPLIHDTVAFSS